MKFPCGKIEYIYNIKGRNVQGKNSVEISVRNRTNVSDNHWLKLRTDWFEILSDNFTLKQIVKITVQSKKNHDSVWLASKLISNSGNVLKCSSLLLCFHLQISHLGNYANKLCWKKASFQTTCNSERRPNLWSNIAMELGIIACMDWKCSMFPNIACAFHTDLHVELRDCDGTGKEVLRDW